MADALAGRIAAAELAGRIGRLEPGKDLAGFEDELAGVIADINKLDDTSLVDTVVMRTSLLAGLSARVGRLVKSCLDSQQTVLTAAKEDVVRRLGAVNEELLPTQALQQAAKNLNRVERMVAELCTLNSAAGGGDPWPVINALDASWGNLEFFDVTVPTHIGGLSVANLHYAESRLDRRLALLDEVEEHLSGNLTSDATRPALAMIQKLKLQVPGLRQAIDEAFGAHLFASKPAEWGWE